MNFPRASRLFGLCAALALAGARSSADELPRYHLVPGRVLVYRSADMPDDFETGGGEKLVIRGDYEWRVYVIRQNDDRSWRLAFAQTWKSRVLSPRAGDTRLGEPSILHDDGFFDLTADGQATENWTIHSFANPLVAFPPLPPTAESFGGTWQSNLEVDRTRRTLRRPPGNASAGSPLLDLAEEDQRYEDAAHLTSRRREFIFDRQRGLITRLVTHTNEKWSHVVRPAVPIELAEFGAVPGEDRTLLAADCDRYFVARNHADRCLRAADSDWSHVDESIEEARTTMERLKDELQLAPFREMLAHRLDQQAGEADRCRRRANKYGPLLGTPSPDWTTTDLEGTTHRLEDYRGKIVVLDFWFRSCSWCIRAMPELTELAAQVDRSRVAIMGVNMDRNDENARFVVGALNLNYPTLRNGEIGEGIDKKYEVDGGPTVIVIDGRGTIRHIHLAFTPTLGEELRDEIRSLLGEGNP